MDEPSTSTPLISAAEAGALADAPVGALAEHDFLPIEDAATGLLAERCGVALARTQRMQMKRAGRCRPDDIVCHPYKTCAAMAAAWQGLEPEAARAVECP